MRKNIFKGADLNWIFSSNALNGGGGNDPDTKSKSNNEESSNESQVIGGSDLTGGDMGGGVVNLPPSGPFITGIVDSKTKGYERFADCFVNEFGPVRNSIKLNTLNSKVFRI